MNEDIVIHSNLAPDAFKFLFGQRPSSEPRLSKKKADYKCVAKPMPDWFSIDSFREVLREKINHVIDGTWESASTPQGIIWFKLDSLFDALLVSSGGHPDVANLFDMRDKGEFLFSALKACGESCVAWSLIGAEGHFSTRCQIERLSGLQEKMIYLTPIKSNFFYLTPGILERDKSRELKEMVCRITSEKRPKAK